MRRPRRCVRGRGAAAPTTAPAVAGQGRGPGRDGTAWAVGAHEQRRCTPAGQRRTRPAQRRERPHDGPAACPAAEGMRGAESATISASAGAHLDQGATGPPPGGGRAHASVRPRRGRGGYRCPIFRRGLSSPWDSPSASGCVDAQNSRPQRGRLPRRGISGRTCGP